MPLGAFPLGIGPAGHDPVADAAERAADQGRSSANCNRHSTQATALAQPVSRRAPMRCTTSPL